MIQERESALKRTISLPLLVLYGLGNIIGAGIYVLIGKVAGVAGYLAPVAFLVASLVAAFTALTYSELSARYPLSAGEAIYLQEGFQRTSLSITAGLLIAFGGIVSAAAITKGLVGYLQALIPLSGVLVIPLLLCALCVIAIWGITESLLVAALFTIIEIAGLLFIVWVAHDAIYQLPVRLPDMIPSLQPGAWAAILAGGFLAFYAFIGFEDMVNVAEEVKNPTRNLPVAILTALILSTMLYAAVSLISVLAVSPTQLADSDAPLALIYREVTGREPLLISIVSLFAVVNGALIQIIMVSRILYGMSRKRWLPRFLCEIDPRTHTPVKSTILVAILVLTFALFVPLVTLASLTSLVLLVLFTLLNLALLLIKQRDPHPAGIAVVPRCVPVFGFLTSIGLIASQVMARL